MSSSSSQSLREIMLRSVGMLARVGFLLLLSVRFSDGFRATFQPGRRMPPPLALSPQPLQRLAPSKTSFSSSLLSAQNGEEGLSSGAVRFRCGRSEDEPVISFTMAKELMNPLGISHKNFVVAEDTVTGNRVGWAQIRSLGPAGVDPSEFDSPPGSMIPTSIEDDVDELMWEEFENDPSAEFAGGRWQSTLPWTNEYREAFSAAEERREHRAQLVAREEENTRNQKQRQQRGPQLWELASVYVVPERRSEGIGSDLVRSVLDQHKQLGRVNEAVYALTLTSTVDWYRSNFGFVEVADSKDVPKPMALEVAAGKIITKLMGNELVCLQMPLERML